MGDYTEKDNGIVLEYFEVVEYTDCNGVQRKKFKKMEKINTIDIVEIVDGMFSEEALNDNKTSTP